jgi:peptidoglycan/LPS O-acetylase OafA/YrhL
MPAMNGTDAALSPTARLKSLDALRGVAAMIVLLYHFSRRFGERFDDTWHPWISYDGQFGVLLFFMISGYVITLSTERVHRARDFLFLRFSRLYPTFWFCLALTTAIVAAAQFPLPVPTPLSVAVNATMLTKTIRRLTHQNEAMPYVDGSYWSLEIELFFYAIVFVLLLTRQMRHIVWVALGFVLLRLVDLILVRAVGATLPSVVQWAFFLEYWPYFGLGIAAFAFQHRHERLGPALLACFSFLSIASGGVALTVTMLICTAAFLGAIYDVLPFLRWRPLVWLGVISYPLYLLHQNIGYVVIRAALHWGLSTEGAIAAALVTSLGLATAVTFAIERPSMRLLRQLFKRWTNRNVPPLSVSGLAPAEPVMASTQPR